MRRSSSAPDATLHEAQLAKLDRSAAACELQPGDRLLEIGTGWGGLALHAAGRYGAHVTTTTISREQHAYASAAVRAAGLEDRVAVLLQDYRDLRGRYDKLVSIEMIEAVGWEHLDTYFARVRDLLEPHGAMLLQAIVHPHRVFRVEKASTGFINAYIFPGGTLPSLPRSSARSRAAPTCAPSRSTTSRRTTRARCAAGAALPRRLARAAQLGYDERFRRMWDLYLAYCEAGFRERRISRRPAAARQARLPHRVASRQHRTARRPAAPAEAAA